MHIPRVAQCQHHCANPEFTSVEDFIKKTVAIPFLDHLISDVSSRFTAHSKMAATLQALLLVNITPAKCCVNIQEAIDLYFLILKSLMKKSPAGSQNGYLFPNKIVQKF